MIDLIKYCNICQTSFDLKHRSQKIEKLAKLAKFTSSTEDDTLFYSKKEGITPLSNILEIHAWQDSVLQPTSHKNLPKDKIQKQDAKETRRNFVGCRCRYTALALTYSTAEYCALVWYNKSHHTHKNVRPTQCSHEDHIFKINPPNVAPDTSE